MATPYPVIDWTYLPNQQDRDEFERRVFQEGAGLAMCDGLPNHYRLYFRRPGASGIMVDVLSGRWGLGTTMEEVAENLWTDHGTISRALHKGELSGSLEAFLRACPRRPKDLERKLDLLIPMQSRCAFIASAEYLMRRDRPDHRLPRIREVDAECLMALLENRQLWDQTAIDGNQTVVTDIISCVCDCDDSDILPFWFTKRERHAVMKLGLQLQTDATFRFEYLRSLYRDWRQAFLAAAAATESIRWDDQQTMHAVE